MTNRFTPILLALLSAALFGIATPASKLLLDDFSPLQLAGLLYLGAALGVAPTSLRGGVPRWPPDRRNRRRLLGAVVAGGVLGPVLLLLGLRAAAASTVSLWLNFELTATALLGVAIFREHLGITGWIGVAMAFAGAILLSAPEGGGGIAAAALVLAACACWGVDNHLTALIDGLTPSQSTFWKGLVAGTTNLLLGVMLQPFGAPLSAALAALGVGALAYGASISLYILAAQSLGATRGQIVFSSAPFFGVLASIAMLDESLTWAHAASAALFVAAIVAFAFERHAHVHRHDAIEHEHPHRHDDAHHDHAHDDPALDGAIWHSHRHRHEPIVHAHPHWPDLHHRHRH